MEMKYVVLKKGPSKIKFRCEIFHLKFAHKIFVFKLKFKKKIKALPKTKQAHLSRKI